MLFNFLMVKIRFQRFGRTGEPFYRIVVTDSRRKRNGSYIKKLGFYNPISKFCSLNIFVLLKWLKRGARPTPVICSLILKHYQNVANKTRKTLRTFFHVDLNGNTLRITSNPLLLKINNLTFRLLLKAYNHISLEQAIRQITRFLRNNNKLKGCTCIKHVWLPTRLRRYCVLSSPHINKSSRDHFELRIHKRLLDFQKPVIRFFKKLSKVNIPSGIDIKVQILF